MTADTPPDDLQRLVTVAAEVWEEEIGDDPMLIVAVRRGRLVAAATSVPTADELRVAAARLLDTADRLAEKEGP